MSDDVIKDNITGWANPELREATETLNRVRKLLVGPTLFLAPRAPDLTNDEINLAAHEVVHAEKCIKSADDSMSRPDPEPLEPEFFYLDPFYRLDRAEGDGPEDAKRRALYNRTVKDYARRFLAGTLGKRGSVRIPMESDPDGEDFILTLTRSMVSMRLANVEVAVIYCFDGKGRILAPNPPGIIGGRNGGVPDTSGGWNGYAAGGAYRHPPITPDAYRFTPDMAADAEITAGAVRELIAEKLDSLRIKEPNPAKEWDAHEAMSGMVAEAVKNSGVKNASEALADADGDVGAEVSCWVQIIDDPFPHFWRNPSTLHNWFTRGFLEDAMMTSSQETLFGRPVVVKKPGLFSPDTIESLLKVHKPTHIWEIPAGRDRITHSLRPVIEKFSRLPKKMRRERQRKRKYGAYWRFMFDHAGLPEIPLLVNCVYRTGPSICAVSRSADGGMADVWKDQFGLYWLTNRVESATEREGDPVYRMDEFSGPFPSMTRAIGAWTDMGCRFRPGADESPESP